MLDTLDQCYMLPESHVDVAILGSKANIRLQIAKTLLDSEPETMRSKNYSELWRKNKNQLLTSVIVKNNDLQIMVCPDFLPSAKILLDIFPICRLIYVCSFSLYDLFGLIKFFQYIQGTQEDSSSNTNYQSNDSGRFQRKNIKNNDTTLVVPLSIRLANTCKEKSQTNVWNVVYLEGMQEYIPAKTQKWLAQGFSNVCSHFQWLIVSSLDDIVQAHISDETSSVKSFQQYPITMKKLIPVTKSVPWWQEQMLKDNRVVYNERSSDIVLPNLVDELKDYVQI